MTALVPVPDTQPPEAGSRPLRNPEHEAYARHRALLSTPRQAVIKLGLSPTSGVMTKLEKKTKIQDRIAYLTRQDVDIIRDKRRELEEFWWLALRSDPAEFFEVSTHDIIDKEGNVIGSKEIERLKFLDKISPDLRQLVEVTEKGVRLVQKTDANKELRKMLGLDAPARSEVEHSGHVTLEALVMASLTPPTEQPKTIEHADAA